MGEDGFQIRRARKSLTAGQFTGRIDGLTVGVAVPPASDGIELFETEPDGIENPMAVGADGIGAMEFGPLAEREMGDRRGILLIERGDVRRGGRHVFAEHLFQHPDAALHGAGAIG